MATELAKGYVQIIPSARGIGGKLSQTLNNEMPSAGKEAGGILGSSLAGKIKGVLVTAGIGKAISASITEGAGLQQSLGGVETMFKSSADKVVANANQAYKTAGMSANQYMEMVTGFSASLLQSMGGNTAAAADLADVSMRDMSDNANKFGTDMASIQNAYNGFAKQNYTMLDNLKLGYGGTKGEMERLLADAEKLSGVDYNIDSLADVYSAIHIIQEEMGVTGTTALEASETISGSLSSMKASFQNVLGNLALGQDIRPALDALLQSCTTFFGSNLLPAIGNVLSGLPTILDSAVSLAVQSIATAASNAEGIVQFGIDLVTRLGSSIITAIPSLAGAAMQIIGALGSAIINTDWMAVGQNIITSFRASIATASVEILGNDSSMITAVCDSIQHKLPDLLTKGAEILTSVINGILSKIPDLLKSAGQVIQQLLNAFLSALPSVMASGVKMIKSLVNGIVDNLPAIASAAIKVIKNLLTTIASHLPDLLRSGFKLIGELGAGIIKAIPNIIKSAGKIVKSIWNTITEIDWIELGKNIIWGLIDGIGSMGSALWDAAKNVAASALSAIKSFFGIASPSKVMRDQVGKFLPAGIAIGIKENTQPITLAMQALRNDTTSVFSGALKTGGLGFQVHQKESNVLGVLAQMLHILRAGQRIVLDTGALVGSTIADYDNALGDLATLAERGAI